MSNEAKYEPPKERFFSDSDHTSQLYLEYLHDQACINRDAILRIIADTPAEQLSDALYEHLYEQSKRGK
jgi:hypothetical protein